MPLYELGNPVHPSGSNEFSPRVPTGPGQTSHSDAAAQTVLPSEYAWSYPSHLYASSILPRSILPRSILPRSVPLILIASSSISSDCSNPLSVNRIDYSPFSKGVLMYGDKLDADAITAILQEPAPVTTNPTAYQLLAQLKPKHQVTSVKKSADFRQLHILVNNTADDDTPIFTKQSRSFTIFKPYVFIKKPYIIDDKTPAFINRPASIAAFMVQSASADTSVIDDIKINTQVSTTDTSVIGHIKTDVQKVPTNLDHPLSIAPTAPSLFGNISEKPPVSPPKTVYTISSDEVFDNDDVAQCDTNSATKCLLLAKTS